MVSGMAQTVPMMTSPAARPGASRRRTLRVALAASASLTVAVTPVFLLGALSDDIGEDLGFGSARTGIAITVFFVAGALTAVAMGRVTDRIGATSSMRLGVALTGFVLLLTGSVVGAWWHLAVLLALGGMAVGLVDTGGARAFADAIRAERQGVAFGVKEASVPAAALLAGLSIPVLAQGAGWQPTFLVAACGVPLVLWLVPGGLRGSVRPAVDEPVRSTGGFPVRLVVFAAGVGAAAAASSASATLFVPAVTDGGLTASSAGLLLATGSVASIVVRIAVGWVGDRSPHVTSRMLSGSILLGAVGAGLLVLDARPLLVPAALLLLGAGWGWSGLAFLAAVRANPDAPATAAGVVLTGLAGGGSVGPAAFGLLASAWSYSVSWMACAGALVLGAALVFVARPRLPAS
jgi:MFS family permease